MNVRKIMTRLNAATARYDAARGGVPEYTAQDVAGALAMVADPVARDVFSLDPFRPDRMYPKQYDKEIGEAAALYLPQWHWLWLKAQLIAESALDANAVSKAGAQGIALFMPATWDDVRAALRFPAAASPFEPRYAIRGAAWYLRLLRQQWRTPRPEDDRRRLVQASYNAGLGNVVKAQQRAGGAVLYAGVIAHLHEVTCADNARETSDYVVRIARIQHELFGV